MADPQKDWLTELHQQIDAQDRQHTNSIFRSVIQAPEAENYCQTNAIDIYELMFLLVPIAQKYAFTPISHFPVGAVILGESGNLYLGANAEFLGQGLQLSVHAEQAAINTLLVSGYHETSLQALAVSAAPCGHCRQFLYEIENTAPLKILIQSAKGSNVSTSLKELLPSPFGPKDLNITDSLLTFRKNQLSLKLYPEDEVIKTAFTAANASYAPYTKSYAGAALQTQNGLIFAGLLCENAAYNPSLSPIQSATSHLLQWHEGFSAIIRAVLVETQGALCSQVINTSSILNSIAPEITLEIYQTGVQA